MGDFKLSQFQEKKLRHIFEIFYDINGDGFIEWKDFDLAIKNICKLQNWSEGGEMHAKAMTTMTSIWKALLKYADANKDNKVSAKEWIMMWTESIKDSKNTGQLPEWVNRYREFMFLANDTSGDNLIDIKEYKTVYMSYGISAADCERAFNKFSEDEKVKITPEEFEKLFMEYFVSDNPNAKGNALFGKTDF